MSLHLAFSCHLATSTVLLWVTVGWQSCVLIFRITTTGGKLSVWAAIIVRKPGDTSAQKFQESVAAIVICWRSSCISCIIVSFVAYCALQSDVCIHLVVSIVIHAEHVVHSAWILFWLWMYVCMFVCLYVSALERKRLIGMTWNSEP